MIAALELDGRFTRAGNAIAYLAVTLPVTLLALPAVAALILGAALSVAGIGLPLLLAAATFCRSLERLDRRAANRWLGAQVPPLPRRRLVVASLAAERGQGGAFRRSLDLLSDRTLWRTATHLALRPLLLVRDAAGRARRPCSSSRCCCSSGSAALAGAGEVDYVGPWTLNAGLGLVLCALALPAAALALADARDALSRPVRQLARAAGAARCRRAGRCARCWPRASATAPSRSPTGCPTASASWTSSAARSSCRSPARGARGPPSTATASGVAAIIHDAALDTSRELVMAAAAASSLAIDNERLKADLQARVRGAAAVAAADHRGGRRGAAPDRARPARRRAAAARRARAGPADAQDAAEGPGRSTSCPRGSRPRWPSCASWLAASTPRSSPTAGSRPRSSRWPTAARSRSRPTSRSTERLPAPRRGRRLLPRRRGADQRRALRGGHECAGRGAPRAARS